MPEVTLSAMAHVAMLQAAQATADEVCGLLLGQGSHIAVATLARNVDPDPATRFEIDPVALIAAFRAEREGGPQVLGYWHSHPTGQAAPSRTDRDRASGDGRIWAIVAGGAITLWVDRAAGFEALPYSIQDG